MMRPGLRALVSNLGFELRSESFAMKLQLESQLAVRNSWLAAPKKAGRGLV